MLMHGSAHHKVLAVWAAVRHDVSGLVGGSHGGSSLQGSGGKEAVN